MKLLKKILYISVLLTSTSWVQKTLAVESSSHDESKPAFYNHSAMQVVLYMHTDSANVSGSKISHDPNTLINPRKLGLLVSPGGAINWLPETKSVSVYYSDKEPTICSIDTSYSYTIRSSSGQWIVSKD